MLAELDPSYWRINHPSHAELVEAELVEAELVEAFLEDNLSQLSHTDSQGRAKMVDVGDKVVQRRTARASGRIALAASTMHLIRENLIKKGDVLTVAQIAGIQAAKRTGEMIPLCHPLVLDSIDVQMELHEDGVTATSEVRCDGRTGVEMEALTAVSIALLTIYDMCKAVDKNMRIGDIRLIEKVKQDASTGSA